MANSSKDIKSLFRKQLGSKFPKTKLDVKSKSSNPELLHNINTRKRKFKKDDSIDEVKTKSILKNKIDLPVSNNQSSSGQTTSDKKVKFGSDIKSSIKLFENEDKMEEEVNVPEVKPNDVMSIPDGFFDDPHLELKTKKVLPKSKMDEDYELFLKSIDAVSKENEEKMEQESQSDAVKLQIVENINETIIWNSFNNLINSIEEKKSNLIESGAQDNSPSGTSSDQSDDGDEDGDVLWRNKSFSKFH